MARKRTLYPLRQRPATAVAKRGGLIVPNRPAEGEDPEPPPLGEGEFDLTVGTNGSNFGFDLGSGYGAVEPAELQPTWTTIDARTDGGDFVRMQNGQGGFYEGADPLQVTYFDTALDATRVASLGYIGGGSYRGSDPQLATELTLQNGSVMRVGFEQ